MDTNLRRWTVPGVAAIAVAAAVIVPAFAFADSTDLPERSPEELLTAVAQSEPIPMSGTAVYTARLGLPEIPAEFTGGADPLNLLAGSSTIRMWTDGQDRSRVSLLGSTSEYTVVTHGAEAWTYASATNQVEHLVLDEQTRQALAEYEQPHNAGGEVPTPEQLAAELLATARQHAEVAVGDPVVVAGRPAYQLVLTPSTPQTLVERVVIALDGETLVPLSVQAWSTEYAEAPAMEFAYTDVSYATPSEASLTFSVPAGAQVQERLIDLSDHLPADAVPGHDPGGSRGSPGSADGPRGAGVTGEGFDTVVERAGVDVPGLLSGDPGALADGRDDSPWAGRPGADLAEEFGPAMGGLDVGALYEQLTVEVDGGRVLSTRLGTVLIADDGRVLAGLVPVQTLLAAAGLE